MFALGIAETIFLSLLAFVGALAVSVRARFEGRAETAVAAGILWFAIILVPIYALGLTNHLTRTTLGWTSAFVSISVLVIAGIRTDQQALLRRVADAALGIARLPFDGVREAWNARSVVLAGVLFSGALILWTGLSAYFAPSWRQWDALWYHEPIVGFTIQNHGFATVPLPPDGLQKINGYPRLCEMTQLWFVIFTDRRLIDFANSAFAPLFMLVIYVMAKRQSGDRVVSMGWASALLIAPVTSIQLQSAYVDVETTLFVIAAAHFCTRAPLRIRDAGLAVACLAMALGAKILALVPVTVLSIIALARLVSAYRRSRPRETAFTAVFGAAVLAATASITYWRNWRHFHNPFWPDLEYDNPKYGIHWPGMPGALEAPLPLSSMAENLTEVPYARALGHANQIYEFGFTAGWFIFPVAFSAVLALVFIALRSLAARALHDETVRMSEVSVGALYIALILTTTLYLGPASFWSARYYLVQFVLAVVLIAWAGGRSGFARLGEGAVAVAVVGAIIAFFWVKPRWWLTPTELRTLAAIPYPEREVTPAAKLSPALSLTSGSAVTSEFGLAREATLGPDSVVAFDDSNGVYVALYWNNRFSNRLVYVPAGADYLARVDQTGATWLYCSYADPIYGTLKQASSGWVEIGPVTVEHWGAMFRRR